MPLTRSATKPRRSNRIAALNWQDSKQHSSTNQKSTRKTTKSAVAKMSVADENPRTKIAKKTISINKVMSNKNERNQTGKQKEVIDKKTDEKQSEIESEYKRY